MAAEQAYQRLGQGNGARREDADDGLDDRVGVRQPPAHPASNTALRVLLAAPFLLFALEPSVPVAAVLVAVATAGYGASLAQQEWLVALTPGELRGQVLGVESAVRVTGQGVFAALAGALADVIAVGTAMAVFALVSLVVALTLVPGLRRAADRAAVR